MLPIIIPRCGWTTPELLWNEPLSIIMIELDLFIAWRIKEIIDIDIIQINSYGNSGCKSLYVIYRTLFAVWLEYKIKYFAIIGDE